MDFTHTDDSQPAVDYLAKTILEHLEQEQRVLLLLAGGSNIGIAVELGKQLAGHDLGKLSISLNDERHVPIGHADSNWHQLAEAGFDAPGATLLPILDGKDLAATASDYNQLLHQAYAHNDYKIALFGIGPDGHIAGLLPGSPALDASDDMYATGYSDDEIKVDSGEGVKRGVARLTMTPAAISHLDEAVCFAMGDSKLPVIQELQTSIETSQLPAALLKNLPKVTIFSDQIQS